MQFEADRPVIEDFLNSARAFWSRNLPTVETDHFVVADCMHIDFRYVLRNLTVANLQRAVRPAHLVAVIGSEPAWVPILGELSVVQTRQLAEAFGATRVIDIHELASSLVQRQQGGFELFTDPPMGNVADTGLSDDTLAGIVDATYARVKRVPRVTPEDRDTDRYQGMRAHTQGLASVVEALFRSGSPDAVVAGHLCYSPYQVLAEAARRRGANVYYVTAMGSLKVDVIHGSTPPSEIRFEEILTDELGDFFNKFVMSSAQVNHNEIETLTRDSKLGDNRPAWWREDTAAAVQLQNPTERNQMRDFVVADLGLDGGKKTVTVFNHCVSDALGVNVENFEDLAAWFEAVADFAVQQPEVNWLFLDHPTQFAYDDTDFFGSVASRHLEREHMHFYPSLHIPKNALWSVTDYGVTLRGSVAGELPAYGIPVLQAGYSPWSLCDVSIQAHTQAEFWTLLGDAVDRLSRGSTPAPELDADRARTWMWFYRKATDITTPLVPPWSHEPGNDLLQQLTATFDQHSLDSDAALASLRRAIERREPALTAADLTE